MKVIPHSVGFLASAEEGGGGNRISEERIKYFLDCTLGDAPRPSWGVPQGWGSYLSGAPGMSPPARIRLHLPACLPALCHPHACILHSLLRSTRPCTACIRHVRMNIVKPIFGKLCNSSLVDRITVWAG